MATEIIVDLGERSYPIHFCSSNLEGIGEFVKPLHSACQCVLLSDENVAPLYGEIVRRGLEDAGYTVDTLIIPAGEKSKSIQRFGSLCEELVEHGLGRDSLLVALGGGVVGDLAGFVAASYMRGIPYVQIPTTLLAQVDSSVGGKTAVNLPQGKNLVGAFYQPLGVFIDSSVLDTLAERDLRSGMVEVIKYGIIWDEQFFSWLEQHLDGILGLDPEKVLRAVRRSCEIKAQVVSTDEREAGLRAILNYGHTAGHAIESLSSYADYRHGEALAVGMEVAAILSQHHLGLAEEEAQRQHRLLERLGVPTAIDDQPVGDLMQRISHDKKAVEGKARFVLASRLGKVEICGDVPAAQVRAALIECGASP